MKCRTGANGKKTYYEYTLRGELSRTWGDVPYPEERFYNAYGELTELRTYRGGSGWSGSTWPVSPGTADVTLWIYHDASGLLLSKRDAASEEVNYGYLTNGWLRTRQWTRNVWTTNVYNSAGDLERLDYTGGTASVTYTNYNRAGQPRTVQDASGEHALLYDHASRLVSDKGISGLCNGIIVSNHFHPVFGRDYVRVEGIGTSIQHSYGFDTFGRLGSVSNGTYSTLYGYLPDSDRLQTTTGRSGASPVLTTTRAWDFGARLRSIANTVGGATASSHAYLYDSVHRRTHDTLEDGSRWLYGYDDRDEVTSAKRYWSDWTPVAGQQFEYAFDNIGNRSSSKAGGDAGGASLRSTTYTLNSRNQITQRTVPGAADIVGAATATATNVNVNNVMAYRKGEYYRVELSVNNATAPQWQSVTNRAVQSGTTNSVNGNFLLPKTPEDFTYDLDGNLTADGAWTYTWDAENRLLTQTSQSTVPSSARRKLEFIYDDLGRRVQKIVSTWNGSVYVAQQTNKFVYDGWNPLAELNGANNAVIRSYVWGQDLIGSLYRAGGIGALLMLVEHGGSTTNHFAAYDGQGNVVALVKGDGTTSARYEYGPFGETIRATGPLARSNPFRWSTKFTDEESGLVAYPLRSYNPTLGQWLGRDPIGELGGLNLYGFVFNRPVSLVDPFGLWSDTGDLWLDVVTSDPVPTPLSPYLPGVKTEAFAEGLTAMGTAFLDPDAWQEGISRLEIIPGIGDLFTGLNAGIDFAQGDFAQAGLGIAGVLPFLPGPHALQAATKKGGLPNGIFHQAVNKTGFSNGNFGQAVHDRFRDALTEQTGTLRRDWKMNTAPGINGVDATYIGPASRHPGFDYAELKPNSPGSLSTFGGQLDNWNKPLGTVQLWLYNQSGVIGSSGFNF